MQESHKTISPSITFMFEPPIFPNFVTPSLAFVLQADEDEIYLYSTPNKNWPVITTYKKGQKILIKTIVSAYHWVSAVFDYHAQTSQLYIVHIRTKAQICFKRRVKGTDSCDFCEMYLPPVY